MGDESHDPANSANPYTDLTPHAAHAGDVRVRPTGVTVVGVLACVLGMMGLAMGCWMLINTIIGPRLAQAFTQAGPFQQAQMEMNNQTQQLALKYRFVNVATSLGSMILGGVLLVGGVGAIRGRPWARTLLVRVFLLAMIFECFKLVPIAMLQFEMLPVMEQYMQSMAADPPANNPASANMAATFAKAMLLISFGIWVGWSVIKLACFGLGARYLGRPDVLVFFDSATELGGAS